MPEMSERDKLKRDIATLQESIRLAREEIAFGRITPGEKQQLREEISRLVADLKDLIGRLEASN